MSSNYLLIFTKDFVARGEELVIDYCSESTDWKTRNGYLARFGIEEMEEIEPDPVETA